MFDTCHDVYTILYRVVLCVSLCYYYVILYSWLVCVLLCVCVCVVLFCVFFFFFQAEDGIRDLVRSRGLGDVYKRQESVLVFALRSFREI